MCLSWRVPQDVRGPLSVSVALCTHNGAEFVREQVESVLSQTAPPQEIVLSDDDSHDDTVAIVRELVDEYRAQGGVISFTVLENRPALGVAGNFAQAIAGCTGDLIALSDQDDVWHAERLEVVARYFAEHPDVILVHGDARLIDGHGDPIGRTLFGSLRISGRERRQIDRGSAIHTLIRRNVITGATTVFRRDLVSEALPIPPGWIHDEWFGIIAAMVGRVAIVPGCLVDYRQHDSNQIGVEVVTPTVALRKLREPRAERNRKLLIRAQSLADRLHGAGSRIDQRYARIVAEKVEHERFRLALPVRRVRRIVPVLVSLARGEYRRYSVGFRDAVRDLVQPT